MEQILNKFGVWMIWLDKVVYATGIIHREMRLKETVIKNWKFFLIDGAIQTNSENANFRI